jgi:hypothetical protein
MPISVRWHGAQREDTGTPTVASASARRASTVRASAPTSIRDASFEVRRQRRLDSDARVDTGDDPRQFRRGHQLLMGAGNYTSSAEGLIKQRWDRAIGACMRPA